MDNRSNENDSQYQSPAQIVYIHGGQPVTDTKIIADAVGMEHKNVVQALKNRSFFGALNIQQTNYLDSQGKTQQKYVLDEKHTYMFVMRLTTKKAEEWQEKFVDAFIALRDQAISYQLPYQPGLIEELNDEAERLRAENAELTRTKSHISSGREAKALGKLGAAVKKNKRLEAEVIYLRESIGVRVTQAEAGLHADARIVRASYPPTIEDPSPEDDWRYASAWKVEFPELKGKGVTNLGSRLKKHGKEVNKPVLKGSQTYKNDHTNETSYLNLHHRDAVLSLIEELKEKGII
jgi:Rha family phage regulatory protein